MKEHRSPFWPLVLIAAGAIWLAISANLIPPGNLWALTHIWPYVLILLGAGLILRSFWRPAGAIASALIVIGAALSVVYAPQLGWAEAQGWGAGGNFGGVIPGSGVRDEEARPVEDFDSISINFPADVVVRQGETESLMIEAEDNVLPQLSSEVRSGTLVFENNEKDWAKRVRPSQAIHVTITVKNLKSLQFSTTGTLRMEGLKSEELEINLSGAVEAALTELEAGNLRVGMSGASAIHADGEADRVTLTISGIGKFDAGELAAQTAQVNISGAGEATLRVEEGLEVEISGAGSVNYYGNPVVVKRVSGAGTVNKAGQ